MGEANALIANIMAGISLAVSIVLAIYYIRDRQFAKLSAENEYTRDLLSWSNEVLKVLGRLRLAAEEGRQERTAELRNELSTLIDVGRFFFPNIDKGDGFGRHKPPAFRGYRNLALEFLVAIYDIYGAGTTAQHIREAERMRRYFFSAVFQVVNPKSRIDRIRHITDRYFATEKIYEDFKADNDKVLEYIWQR